MSDDTPDHRAKPGGWRKAYADIGFDLVQTRPPLKPWEMGWLGYKHKWLTAAEYLDMVDERREKRRKQRQQESE